MSLRDLAEADLAATLTDAVGGFGRPVIVINPAGEQVEVGGQTGDIGLIFHPDTGQPVTGRRAHVALRLSDLVSLGEPRGEEDPLKKPWIVEVTGLDGTPLKTKVVEAMPDKSLGLVLCILERYTPAEP